MIEQHLLKVINAGPNPETLFTWSGLLSRTAGELEALGRTWIGLGGETDAWYGGAANAFRAETIQLGQAATGIAEAMDLLSEVLDAYEQANADWNQANAAAKQLDDEGVAQDRQVLSEFKPAALAYGRSHREFVGNESDLTQLVWPLLVTPPPGSGPPDSVYDWDSPLKLQAVKDQANALDALSVAGVLAAKAVEDILSVIRGGQPWHEMGPVVPLTLPPPGALGDLNPLTALGAGSINANGQAVRPAHALGTPTESVSDEEAEREEHSDTPEMVKARTEDAVALHDGVLSSAHIVKTLTADGESTEEAGEGLTLASADLVVGTLVGSILDVATLANNDEPGAHKLLTDANACANLAAGAVAVAIADQEIPVLDVATDAVLVGTAIYTVGDQIYDHFNPAQAELP